MERQPFFVYLPFSSICCHALAISSVFSAVYSVSSTIIPSTQEDAEGQSAAGTGDADISGRQDCWSSAMFSSPVGVALNEAKTPSPVLARCGTRRAQRRRRDKHPPQRRRLSPRPARHLARYPILDILTLEFHDRHVWNRDAQRTPRRGASPAARLTALG